MDNLLKELIDSIGPVDNKLEPVIQQRLDNLTKPKGSLGRLEEFAKRYCLITNQISPADLEKAVIVFAGDHGITQEGVSAFPKDVTYQMVKNFLQGGAGINVLARHVGADVQVVDIGVDHDLEDLPGLIHKKVGFGTKNMAEGPAMTREEAQRAILAGAEVAQDIIEGGKNILATGEMGIGNTTPASALTAVICGKEPSQVTGRGTGIDTSAYRRKIELIERAISVNKPSPTDGLDALAKVGGFEIAGICGMILKAAQMRVPVVVDGFISGAGAIVAKALCPNISDYLFCGHCSVEQGHKVQMEYLGLRPILDLDMRLGEGTGAVLAMGLIEAGIKIYKEMATFDQAAVSPGNEAI
ncbi:MAG: nicotinate-nucleotide--dimethylbenzimidazole phosphoribosyltransferase [Thermodesulfobacteria bacterium]|nr:nicotinate-nucleotide--dimethylbenzimidazole phosphoribosyltransferase [Thermodesulfobacteriota bacterium]